jgi:hypothetical protein
MTAEPSPCGRVQHGEQTRSIGMSDVVDETFSDAPPADESAQDGVIVHWMEPRPMSVGPAGISATAAAAFAAGAAVAVTVLAVMHWLGPERDVRLTRRDR